MQPGVNQLGAGQALLDSHADSTLAGTTHASAVNELFMAVSKAL